MSSKIAIRLESMSCGYGKKLVLQQLSLSVSRGEFVSVIGPNGSGKTTFIRGVSGVLPILEGCIYINEKRLNDLSYRERAQQMAVVNQTINTDDILLEDYVLLGRLPYREKMHFFETGNDYKIAEKNMRLTGTWEMRNKPMNRISGGERQLAAIARALTQETSIILLDEPTAHLDISHQIKILDLIRYLNREEGITVLLVIHDLNLASEFSNRLILLDKGSIFASGSAEEIMTQSNLERVYGAKVLVQPNPISGKPFVFPLSSQ